MLKLHIYLSKIMLQTVQEVFPVQVSLPGAQSMEHKLLPSPQYGSGSSKLLLLVGL